MTTIITCPYCNAQMNLRELGMSKNKIYFYECSKCLSRSPMTWNAVTANSMATMRNNSTQREKRIERHAV